MKLVSIFKMTGSLQSCLFAVYQSGEKKKFYATASETSQVIEIEVKTCLDHIGSSSETPM